MEKLFFPYNIFTSKRFIPNHRLSLNVFLISILHNDIITGEMPWKWVDRFNLEPTNNAYFLQITKIMSSKKPRLKWMQVQYDWSYLRRSENWNWLHCIFSLGKSEKRCLPLSIMKMLHHPFFSSNLFQFCNFWSIVNGSDIFIPNDRLKKKLQNSN